MTDRKYIWEIGDVVLVRRRKTEGGPGSGHYGHSGRPGEVGGSEPGEGDFFTYPDPRHGRGRAEAAGGATTLDKKTVTEDERTSARAYKGIAYENINQHCRDIPEHEWPDDIETRVKDLDALMAKSEIASDVVLFRAIGNRLTIRLKLAFENGEIFRDDGYVSASVSQEFAENFRLGGSVCKLLVPKGTKGFAMATATNSDYDMEGEVVLDRGLKFKPVKIDVKPPAYPGGDPKVTYTLRVVKSNPSDTEWFDDVMKTEGGPGSGNFGHAGRPGEVGGSAPSGSAPADDRYSFKLAPELHCDKNAVTTDWKSMSAEEWESARYYCNFGHNEVNKILRGQMNVPKRQRNWALFMSARETTKYLDEMMKKSVLKKDVIVYRGINDGGMKRLNRARGKNFIDKGFVSTAATLRQLEAYSKERGGLPYEHIIAIRVPKGTHAIWIGNRFGRAESELLLDRGLKFKYTKLTKHGTYDNYPYLVVQR